MNDHRGIPEEYFWTEDDEKAFQKGWDACKSEIAASLSREKVLREAVEEGINQIEYLHEKNFETGSGNAVLAKMRHALASTETEAKE